MKVCGWRAEFLFDTLFDIPLLPVSSNDINHCGPLSRNAVSVVTFLAGLLPAAPVNNATARVQTKKPPALPNVCVQWPEGYRWWLTGGNAALSCALARRRSRSATWSGDPARTCSRRSSSFPRSGRRSRSIR
uniref:Uncharacterized protein n=1 Tax=Graphocephala atropunctata TaxID=36148 RepID=A0A1B6MC08_9HEMI